MPTLVVVGAQWGDEGKGKIVNYLAQEADVVVRYNGGNNAGHTVLIGEELFRLSLIPSGIFYPNVLSVIADGLVIDPKVLLEEIEMLRSRGIKVEENLRVSENAHVIMPYHKALDVLEDEARGKGKIGTTGKGIGPAFVDKFARSGIRMAEFVDEVEFKEKLKENLERKNVILRKVYGYKGFKFEEVFDEYLEYARQIKRYVTETASILHRALNQNKRILFEGAQGTFLDIDHGTYPFVTSSHPIAGGACLGTGIGPTKIDKVIGIAKAYTTRVGEGPFPTELFDETAETIRERGEEFGTVTRRPRRCGWLDLVLLRFAIQVNGLDGLAITRLDVLTGLKELKICTSYRCEGQLLHKFPTNLKVLEKCRPVYEELEGWGEDISSTRNYDELPEKAKIYLERIASGTGTKISIVSVGRERNETIRLDKFW